MEAQFGIREVLANSPIVPVVNIEDVADVTPILARLTAQSINCIEITLRSDCAFEAIAAAIKQRPEDFKVGVGTITNASDVERCAALNVDFMVSPGVSDEVANAFTEAKIPFLPGVMTPSEIIQGLNRGWDTFKLFPYNIAGGSAALNNYAKVFSEVKFCPTGGINASNYEEVAALENVICVGGSWVLK